MLEVMHGWAARVRAAARARGAAPGVRAAGASGWSNGLRLHVGQLQNWAKRDLKVHAMQAEGTGVYMNSFLYLSEPTSIFHSPGVGGASAWQQDRQHVRIPARAT
jgi:hypothetical protein